MKKFLIFLAAGVTLTCAAAGLAACADRAEYTVACESSENGYVSVADTKAEAGEKVILAAHPSVGYKLTAFLLDGEVIDGCSFIMPEKDVTVSAQFEILEYSVTYVLGDATVAGNNPDTYTVESAAELTAPEKEGYEICGWYTYCTEDEWGWDIEDYKVTSLEGLYGNLTLYAIYYNPPHEIENEYSGNGYCFVEDYYGQAFYGDRIEVTAVPFEGYELDYITVNGNQIGGTSFTMPACDVKLDAVFKPIRYTITYELDGGVNAPDNPDYYTVEDNYIIFGDAQKDGYVFVGWYYEDEYGQTLFLDDSTFNVYPPCYPLTLYAYFVAEDEEYE